MAAILRVVIDPGVLVSAAISPNGSPRLLLNAWRDGRIELIVSLKLLGELNQVLSQTKFRRYLSVHEAERFVALIRREAELRTDPEDVPGVSADPKDDYLLALARITRASLVVSGHPHLTGLQTHDPPVMSPAQLADLLAMGDWTGPAVPAAYRPGSAGSRGSQ
jgi:putative PIN family toxin of toxin-antitoxin system